MGSVPVLAFDLETIPDVEGIRRLHDTNRSGWWLLISLVPCLGAIVLIVFLATPGDHHPNNYGAPPA